MIDASSDLQEAEKLISAAVESCDALRMDLSGTDAQRITKIRKGLRIALDRLGDAVDALQIKTRPGR